MALENIVLGKSKLNIKPIIFGGNVFGWTLNEKQSFELLDGFIQRGFNAIDTSNNYSHWVEGHTGGESETIIGNWLHNRKGRENLVIMTKVGGKIGKGTKPNTQGAYIIKQVEESLRRLKTDYIDLYQTHYDDLSTPVEETLRAYDDLIKQGKVRYIGASNISKARLTESLAVSEENGLASYISLQPEYNLFDREKFEKEYKILTKQKQIAVIPYYSLASGFLTGKYQTEESFSQSIRGEGIKERYWNDRGREIIRSLMGLSEKYNVSASSIALNWLLMQDSVAAPIASATKDSHLDSFSDALRIQLEDKELEILQQASKY